MSSSLRTRYAEEAHGKEIEPSGHTRGRETEPVTIPFEDLCNLIYHVQQLKKQVQTELAYAEDSAYELGDFVVETCWGTVPINKRPSTESAVKAREVSNTPELAENILMPLGTHDILRGQQVGRVWQDGVHGSIKLLRKIGVYPQDDAHVTSPFEGNPWSSPDHVAGLEVRRIDEEFDLYEPLRTGATVQSSCVTLPSSELP